SHPEERIVFAKIKNLSATVKDENLTRLALIIVGKAVETASLKKAVIKSKLYDAGFSHGFRGQTCGCGSGSDAVNADTISISVIPDKIVDGSANSKIQIDKEGSDCS
ncbi:MAG: hypothetical protein HQK61_10925, partial [Desulfamplus sp.]|nr:hypothetical protein [Desulfamplus sp.]